MSGHNRDVPQGGDSKPCLAAVKTPARRYCDLECGAHRRSGFAILLRDTEIESGGRATLQNGRTPMSTPGDLIVSVSGIRGVVGDSLTPQVALAFASALAVHLNGGAVVVGRDGRPSGLMLRHAVLSGLAAAGCEIHDVGV